MIPLLIALGAGFLVLFFYQRTSADIPPESDVPTLGLRGTFLPVGEDAIIVQTAHAADIDARLLAAVRKAEMGGPGREFGVVSVSAPTYQEQATVAARTIANTRYRYEAEKGISAMVDGSYTDDFIAYLGARYAPVGAANDPTGLNNNWVNNVVTWYHRIQYA